jgi:hypothetical protein
VLTPLGPQKRGVRIQPESAPGVRTTAPQAIGYLYRLRERRPRLVYRFPPRVKPESFCCRERAVTRGSEAGKIMGCKQRIGEPATDLAQSLRRQGERRGAEGDSTGLAKVRAVGPVLAPATWAEFMNER